MAKAADPKLLAILQEYGEEPKDAMWDCHGTWVIYHSAVERIAAKAGIKYGTPSVLVAEREAAAILVTGTLGAKTEWSIGEAAINLNYRVSGKQAAYPFAMAEKRAKDRVVLKLVGLHGLAYSEEEADDFNPDSRAPARQVGINPQTGMATAHALKKDKGPDNWDAFQSELLECNSGPMLTKLALGWSTIAERDLWPTSWRELAKEEINKRREVLKNNAPDDDVFPGDRPSNYVSNLQAG